FNISGTVLFHGWIDGLTVFNLALADAVIPQVKNGSMRESFTTTLPLPTGPLAPSNLVATASGTSTNEVTWADNASNETSYEVYRSEESQENYVLIATLAPDAVSFSDAGLFPNSTHYYHVRATNDGGNSAYSNADSARTLAVKPVVKAISDQYVHYTRSLEVPVTATVSSSESLSFTFANLPAFGSFVAGSANGTGTLKFIPGQTDQGNYNNITVTATDAHGGTTSVSFNLVVNDNFEPVITEIETVQLEEKTNKTIAIIASDANAGDQINWSFEGLPSFATPIISGDTVRVVFAPGYADNGIYPVVVKADDGKHGVSTSTFNVLVNDVTPASRKIYLNFTPSTGQFPVGAPWNSTNRLPSLNADFPNLVDDAAVNTGIGFKILTPWQNQNNGTNSLGSSTGNNSGMYPDNVLKTAYFTDATPQSMRFYKLDPASKYSFTFYGSRGAVVDDRTSVYTINGSSVSLNAASNLTNTVTLYNMQPSADSSLTVTLTKGGASAFGYLNAMIIETSADDGSAPAKPRDVHIQITSGKVDLTWTDAAYNESAYHVYRSTNVAGTYELVTPGGNNANITQFVDSSIKGNTKYFYYVQALNSVGLSNPSDTVSVITPNTSPVVGIISNVAMKTQGIYTQTFSLSDDAGDVVTLTNTGLPAFATITNNGDGTGTLRVIPQNSKGSFNVTLTATDDKGASTTRQFSIAVTDKDITSMYVNFNTTIPVGFPWNSFNSLPYAGRVLTNLRSDNDSATSISVTLIDAWESANDLGAVTGDNTGIYPDQVMKTVFYESTTAVKRIKISGLTAPNRKYNLIFFASRLGGDNRTTNYQSGGQTVSLNAANNVNNTVQINGLIPDATGSIEFTAQKATGSLFAYLGALVIQSYVDDGTPLAPTNLQVVPKSKTAIGLTWSDKSAGEQGFEIHRSETFGGTYSLVHTTAPNATSYVDQTLQANKTYYYKVRSKLSPLFSEFSNIAGTATYSYSVYMNFNRANNAALPWNNTARVPEQDFEFVNLKSEQNNPTGINIIIAKNFSGDNPDGMNTGNNSGVYPDAVLRSSWWVDKGSTAQLRIKNLNRAMRYSFVFLGSRNGSGDRTSVYTINGKSVSLNASMNTTQTVQLDYVEPDENGEVLLTVSMTEWAMFAYLNSMVIHSYKVAEMVDNQDGQTINSSIIKTEPRTVVMAPAEVMLKPESNVEVVEPELSLHGLSAFPNPFVSEVTIATQVSSPLSNVTIQVFDISGRIIHRQVVRDVPSGRWVQRISLNGKANNPGIYVIQLLGPDNRRLGSFKLIKK
ncbi:MAG: T9SS type A sorting domain-containing protein, partial [Pedobacter sp.]